MRNRVQTRLILSHAFDPLLAALFLTAKRRHGHTGYIASAGGRDSLRCLRSLQ